MYKPLYLFVVLFFLISSKYSLTVEQKGEKNLFIRQVLKFSSKRAKRAYNHSLNKVHRASSDCTPECPSINVWQYKYKDKDSNIIESSDPISTKKEHWKISSEARIIALTLFGNDPIYIRGILDFIKSIDYIAKKNNIKDPLWGYKSFTLRVYVAKRNPFNKNVSPLKNATSDEFIKTLLDLGCEIAYVDNNLSTVRRDATFWRFMVAAEEMPKGERIRYLLRDVDWKVTTAEMLTIAEWIDSSYEFHRMHLVPVCMGPLTASVWGGTHESKGRFSNLKDKMQFYPYRFEYGDDELFLRDIVWPVMKYSGSILTHLYKRGWTHYIANPYKFSCEEPTQLFCDAIRKGGTCEDRLMPKNLKYPVHELANYYSIENIEKKNKAYIKFNLKDKRIKKAVNILYSFKRNDS